MCAKSSSPEEIHNKMKGNSQDLEEYLRELFKWEKEIKEKDQEMTEAKKCKRNTGPFLDQEVKADKEEEEDREEEEEEEEDEELEIQWRKQKALISKDNGNRCFKEKKYEEAIEHYTVSIECDPTNAVLYANRAMALLKLNILAVAEEDCSHALELDGTYIKAYHRRGVARAGQKKCFLAEDDFRKVLELDPHNKEAMHELEKVAKEIKLMKQRKASDKDTKTEEQASHEKECKKKISTPSVIQVQPVEKPHLLQSKKPLKRIHIKEVGELPKINSNEENNLIPESRTLPVDERDQTTCSTLPPPPETYYQFLLAWQKLRKFPESQYRYLKSINATKLPQLFGHSLEIEMISDIIKLLLVFFTRDEEDVYPYLHHLSKVSRFSTLIMFMGAEQIQSLGLLFQYIKAKNPDQDLSNLEAAYNLS